MTASRGLFLKFGAAAVIAVLVGLLAPISATEALAGSAQRASRMAAPKSPGWRGLPVYARQMDRPFLLIVGISY
jgi:hypothetical protein